MPFAPRGPARRTRTVTWQRTRRAPTVMPHPYVWAWCTFLGWAEDARRAELARAQLTDAPADAVFWDVPAGRWYTLEECPDAAIRRTILRFVARESGRDWLGLTACGTEE